MKLKKNLISRLVFALLLAFTLALLPMQAFASGSGAIEKVDIKLSMPAVQAADVDGSTATTTTGGCYISSMGWYDVYGQLITDKFTADNATVEIKLTAAPGYYFADYVAVSIDGAAASRETDGSTLWVSKSFSPYIWAPSVVKHPGSEKTVAGGMVSFVSYASCTDKSEWGLFNPKGDYISTSKLIELFPGLVVEESYDKLKLYPVPKELNGYKVICTFTGPGGSVASNKADISVAGGEEAASSAAPVVTPAPTPTPPPHEHKFSQELIKDAGFHWYECECGEMQFRAEHAYTWTQMSAATLEGSGQVQGKCNICGYIMNCETQLDQSAIEEAPEATPEPEEAEPEKKGLIKRIFSLLGIGD